jgi:saccharopine dehydrogenase-like NADP-dependent oxidoreductase
MTGAPKTKVFVLGAGRVGLATAEMLRASGDFAVLLGDCTDEGRGRAEQRGFEAVHVDGSREEEIVRKVEAEVLVAAVPDRTVPSVAVAAARMGIHYLDFSQSDPKTLAAAAEAPAGAAFLPGCGVSPGLVDDIAAGLAGTFPGRVDLDIRVGAIPRKQVGRLGYGLIWNIDGLYDEYTNPCEVVRDGERLSVPPLSNWVEFTLDGERYEAFCTARGTEGIVGRLGEKLRNLIYRTIRHPGHLDYMSFLLDDLALRHRRDLLTTVLRNGLPAETEDMVLIRISARGDDGSGIVERTVTQMIEAPRDEPGGAPCSAASLGALACGSAAHAVAMLHRLRDGAPTPVLRRAGMPDVDALLGNPFIEKVARSRFEERRIQAEQAPASSKPLSSG